MLEHNQISSPERHVSPSPPTSSPLVQFALRGLRSCWMPEKNRWSHIYHLDGRAEPNQSVPESDVFYSLNVLLGLSRIRHLPEIHDFDLQKIFETNVTKVPDLPSPKYAYGMALWSAAELQLDIPPSTLSSIGRLIKSPEQWMTFRAQDLGMILIGCVAQSRNGSREWEQTAHDLFLHLDKHYTCGSGLFYDEARGLRRLFSSFATNTYLTLACYIYGEWAGDDNAIALANRCSAKLISLQGPQGEWPWFFYTPKGRVVDFYEVYSVHQDGMAPAFLEHAERHGVPGAREALEKGFMWIYGENQLGRSMLWHEQGLICRSQIRKGEMTSKTRRMSRALVNAAIGGGGKLTAPAKLDLRLECRSYHIGWVIWSFGKRHDMDVITHHPSLI